MRNAIRRVQSGESLTAESDKMWWLEDAHIIAISLLYDIAIFSYSTVSNSWFAFNETGVNGYVCLLNSANHIEVLHEICDSTGQCQPPTVQQSFVSQPVSRASLNWSETVALSLQRPYSYTYVWPWPQAASGSGSTEQLSTQQVEEQVQTTVKSWRGYYCDIAGCQFGPARKKRAVIMHKNRCHRAAFGVLNHSTQAAKRPCRRAGTARAVNTTSTAPLATWPWQQGKSRVISALVDLATSWGHASAVIKLTPTGIVAANVSGTTIHTGLGIAVTHRRGRTATDVNTEQVRACDAELERWATVRLVIIDEMSLIDKSLLCDINNSLQRVRENNEPFGGLSVVLAGDFYQLPPVASTPLYTVPRTSVRHAQREMAGLALYHMFDTVVILTDNMCSKGNM